jgi:hypothetical protein
MATQMAQGRENLRATGLGIAIVVCLGSVLSQFVGCGGDDGTEKTYPVQGAVKFQGAPASGAFVVFHRNGAPVTLGPAKADGAPADPVNPNAQIGPDGSFALTTFRGNDGAPAGEYAVTVQWNKSILQDDAPVAGPNVIPREYSDPKTTPLKVTIKPEANALEPWNIN